jgi:hypothetical protein
MMLDIVLTLTFSVVMLVFMAFPAMKIVNFIESKITLSERMRNIALIGIIVLLSLSIGLFLKFA